MLEKKLCEAEVVAIHMSGVFTGRGMLIENEGANRRQNMDPLVRMAIRECSAQENR